VSITKFSTSRETLLVFFLYPLLSVLCTMRLTGCLLLLSGWLLSLAALLLLAGIGQRIAFVTMAMLVELLGLALIAQRYRSLQRGPR
jgi:ABC-type transport system involved in cytochrome bd biosynthesis fused ATPase/permease subunit